MRERNRGFFDPEEDKSEINRELNERSAPMSLHLVDTEVRRIWLADGLTRTKIYARDRSAATDSTRHRERLEAKFMVKTRRQNFYNLKYVASSTSD